MFHTVISAPEFSVPPVDGANTWADNLQPHIFEWSQTFRDPLECVPQTRLKLETMGKSFASITEPDLLRTFYRISK